MIFPHIFYMVSASRSLSNDSLILFAIRTLCLDAKSHLKCPLQVADSVYRITPTALRCPLTPAPSLPCSCLSLDVSSDPKHALALGQAPTRLRLPANNWLVFVAQL